jgi:hypothetical protein
MKDKHISHLILLGCSVVNVVPMTVLLGMTLGGIITSWMVPVLGALVIIMAVWPWVMAIGGFILMHYKKSGLFLLPPLEESFPLSLVKFCILIILGIPSLALGIAAAVLLLRDGPTHAALVATIMLTALAVVMHLLLHVCAAKEDLKAVFKPPKNE